MDSIISVPRAVVMSPRSMMSAHPKLRSSTLTCALASVSSPLTNALWSAPASWAGSTMTYAFMVLRVFTTLTSGNLRVQRVGVHDRECRRYTLGEVKGVGDIDEDFAV